MMGVMQTGSQCFCHMTGRRKKQTIFGVRSFQDLPVLDVPSVLDINTAVT